MASNVEILISGRDQASPAIRGVGNALQGLHDTAKSSGGGIAGSLQRIGETALGFLTAQAVPALFGMGQAAISAGADFGSVMNRIQAVSGATADELAAMNAKAMELGAALPISARDAADAMYALVTAGYSASDAIAASTGVAQLAASQMMGVGQASEIVAAALRGFGLEASQAGHVVDLLSQTASISAVEVSDIGETIKYVGSVAGAAHQPMEDISAAIALMGNNAIKGSMAGTALRSIITNLQAPTKNSAAAMAELGITTSDSAGHMLPLMAIMSQFRDKMSGMTDAQQAQVAKSIAGKEAMAGFLSIVNAAPGDFDRITSAMQNAEGATDKFATAMNKGLKFEWEQLQGSIETVLIQGFQAAEPILVAVASAATGFVNSLGAGLTAARPALQQVAAQITSIVQTFQSQGAAAGGGAILQALGLDPGIASRVAGMVGQVVTAFQTGLGIAQGVISTVVGFVTGHWQTLLTVLGGGAIGAAIGVVVVAVGGLVSTFMAAGGIIAGLAALVPGLGVAISILTGPIGIVAAAVALLALAWATNWGGIRDSVMTVWSALQPTLSSLASWLSGAIPAAMGLAQAAFVALQPYLQTLAMVLETVVGGAVRTVAQLLTGDFSGAWATVQTTVSTVVAQVGPMVSQLGTVIQTALQAAGTYIQTNLPLWTQAFLTWASGVASQLPGWLASAQTAISTWLSGVASFIQANLPTWTSQFMTWAGGVASQIGTWLAPLWANFQVWLSGVAANLPPQLQTWGAQFSTWAGGVASQIGSWLEPTWASFQTWLGGVPGKIGPALTAWGTAFQTWFNSVTSQVGTWAEPIWTGFQTWLGGVPGKITAQLAAWGTAFQTWFGAKATEITTWADGLWNSWAAWFGSVPGKISSQMTAWGQAFVAWFTARAASDATYLSQLWNQWQTWFQSIPGKISSQLTAWGSAFTSWFSTTKTNITTALSGWQAGLSTWWNTTGQQIPQWFSSWWTNIQTWFNTTKTNIGTAITEWPATIGAAIQGVFTSGAVTSAATGGGQEIVKQTVAGVTSQQPDMLDKVTDTILQVLTAVGVIALATVIKLGARLAQGVASGFTEAQTLITDAVAEVGRLVTEGLEGARAWLEDKLASAFDMVRDSIKGVISAVKKLGDVAASIGNSIPDWMRPGSPMPLGLAFEHLAGVLPGAAAGLAQFGQTAQNAGASPTVDIQLLVNGQSAGNVGAFAQNLVSVVRALIPPLASLGSTVTEEVKTSLGRVNEGLKSIQSILETTFRLVALTLNPPGLPSVAPNSPVLVFFGNVATWARTVVTAVAGVARGFESVKTEGLTALNTVAGQVKSLLEGTFGLIAASVNPPALPDVMSAGNPTITWFRNVTEWAKRVTTAAAGVAQGFEQIQTGGLQALNNAAGPLKALLDTTFGLIAQAATPPALPDVSEGSTLLTWFRNATEWAKRVATAVAGVANGFESVATGGLTALNTTAGSVLGLIKSGIDTITAVADPPSLPVVSEGSTLYTFLTRLVGFARSVSQIAIEAAAGFTAAASDGLKALAEAVGPALAVLKNTLDLLVVANTEYTIPVDFASTIRELTQIGIDMAGAFLEVASTFAGTVTPAATQASQAMDMAAKFIKDVYDLGKQIAKEPPSFPANFQSLITQLVQQAKTVAQTFIDEANTFATNVGPGAVALIDVYSGMDKFFKGLNKAVNAISEGGGIPADAVSKVQGVMDTALTIANEYISKANSFTGRATGATNLETVIGGFAKLAKNVQDILKTLADWGTAGITSESIGPALALFASVLNSLATMSEASGTTAGAGFMGAFADAIRSNASQVYDALREVLAGANAIIPGGGSGGGGGGSGQGDGAVLAGAATSAPGGTGSNSGIETAIANGVERGIRAAQQPGANPPGGTTVTQNVSVSLSTATGLDSTLTLLANMARG